MQKSELTALAEIGALNSIAGKRGHRRSALWQIERVARPAGPLLDHLPERKHLEKSPISDHNIPNVLSSRSIGISF